VTCTATDAAGNTSTCTFKVTVNDTEDPTITCPTDINTGTDDGLCTANVTYNVTFDDNCPGASLEQIAGLPSGSDFPIGTTTNTFKVTDAAGNMATCSFDVTVTDDEDPTVDCPADFSVDSDPGQCGAIVTYQNQYGDNCPGATITCVPESGSFFPVGTSEVVCTVTDAAGNSSSCTFKVTVLDNEDPVFAVCPADQLDLIGCSLQDISQATNLPLATDSENCISIGEFEAEGGSVADNCEVTICYNDFDQGPCPLTITRVFIATDNAGNSSTCTQTFIITYPAIVLNCPGDVLKDANQTPDAIQQAWDAWIDSWKNIASAGCNPMVQYFHNGDPVTNLDDLKNDPPDACGSFEDTIKAVALDNCDLTDCEAVFNVLATTEGLIVFIPGANTTCLNGPNPPTEDDAMALVPEESSITIEVPNCVGNIEPVKTESLVPTGNNGNLYFFKYCLMVEVPNTNLMEETCIDIEITWDHVKPVIHNVPADITIDCEDDLPPVAGGVYATDNVDGSVPVTFEQVPGFSSCGGAFYERRWSASDNCGNTVTRKQTIRLSDDIDPLLEVPEDLVLNCFDEIPEPTYTASDNCSTLDVSFNEERIDHTICTYTLVRTWTARDGCGNQVTKTQTIEVVDNQPPTITPANPMLVGVPNGGEIISYGCETPQVAFNDFNVVDDCCASPAVQTFDDLVASHACPTLGYFRRWRCGYTATDAAGNEATFTFYMLQVDTTPPEIMNLPPDLEVACNGTFGPPSTDVIAVDNCNLNEATPFLRESLLFDPNDSLKQAVVRTWSYTDNCGNRAEASQMISICGFDPAMASSEIGNNVWIDEDQDGLQDSTEVGLNFATICLYAVDTSAGYQAIMIDSTKSNTINGVAGQFQFHHLTPGMYQLSFHAPDSTMTLTYFKQGENDSIDSDVDQITGMTDIIHIKQGDKLPNIDAGFILQSAVLPVELTSFTGRSFDCVNTLDWSTASEIGTDKFELQRSTDGFSFETIVDIPALGGPTIATNYTWNDRKANSENFYRLKIVDLDGTIKYSEIITLDLRCDQKIQQGEIVVYPNPVQSEAKIEFSLDRDMPVKIRVLDKLGRTVYQQNQQMKKGIYIESLDMTELSNGMYSISVQMDGEVRNKTIIKNY
jgi:hypothetical protein